MINKIKLILYYGIIQNLPHSRISNLSNKIRIWYLSDILKIMPKDKNSKFEYGVYISDASKVKLGNYVRINENVFLQGDIVIGNYVMIAPNTSIYTSNHYYEGIDKPMVTYGNTDCLRVIIGNDVWIGRNVVILPGIKIGNGVIIGANAVVTKDIPEYSIAVGIPARVIKKR